MQSDRARFLAKVHLLPCGGCWEWQAARTGGYGRFKLNGKLTVAHRTAYEWWVGPVSDGYDLDHLCRNRACVNPAHLEAVTHRENVRRGTSPLAVKATQTTCTRGHPLSGDNLLVRPDRPTQRQCRECLRVARRDYARRKRADAKRPPA